MKRILLLCGAILAGVIAWVAIARPYAPHYGDAFRGLPSVRVAQLLDQPSQYLKKDVRIEGIVTRMCPNCGCWLVLKDADGKELRVEAGDTTGRLPFRPGNVATVEGQLIKFGDGYEFVGSAVEFR